MPAHLVVGSSDVYSDPNMPPPGATATQKLMNRTAPVSAHMKMLSVWLATHMPIFLREVQNLTSGTSAKGSSSASEAFTKLTIWLSELSSPKTATSTAGMMADKRVRIARFHIGRRICRNPSMMYCPEYVVVMAELCPAASSVSAQSKQPFFTVRNLQKSELPCTSSARSSPVSGSTWPYIRSAASDVMQQLMTMVTRMGKTGSTLARKTARLMCEGVRGTLRDCTAAVCRKRL
mmetsp:Transcript_9347/g.38329  ORF Transcript_9347/g.38329 Transcript_9347/m.38329 type:complete len:234 (-) Transcript_9347:914-1615(-)